MYAQVLALSLAVVVSFLLVLRRNHFVHWLGFVLLTAACLYTHYFAALAPVAMAVYYIVSWLLGRYRSLLGRWLLAHLTVAVLYAPWLMNAFSMTSVSSWQEPTSPWLLPWNVLGSFSLGEVFPFAAKPWLTIAFALLFLLGCYGMYRQSAVSHQSSVERATSPYTDSSGLLPIYLFVPLLVMMGLAWTGRGILDKYVTVALPSFCLTLALGVRTLYSITQAAMGRDHPGRGKYAGNVLAASALALILVTDVVALNAYYTDERYFKHDYRGVAAHVVARERSGDVILADGLNPNIIFERYYTGRSPIQRVDLGEADQEEALLAELAATHERAWLVLNFHEPGRIELWLEEHGYQLYQDEFSNVDLYLYAFPKDIPDDGWVENTAQDTNGPARLAAYKLRVFGETAYLDMAWRVEQPPGIAYKISTRLTDATGLVVWARDRFPIDGIVPSATWQPGRGIQDRMGIPIPLGTLPGPYTVSVVLYEAVTGREVVKANLGPVELGLQISAVNTEQEMAPCPSNLDGNGEAIQSGEPFGEMLALCGYNVPAGPVKAGGTLTLFLLWRVEQTPGEVIAAFRLMDGGKTAMEQRLEHTVHPSSGWQAGEWIRYPYTLKLDPALPSGKYELTIGLEEAASSKPLRGQPLTLTQVDVLARARDYKKPGRIANPLDAQIGAGVRLLGYDLAPAKAAPGDTATLTLYWEALGAMETNYTVFTHLLTPEGGLAAGKDSPPLNGDAPTMSWLKGEFLADRYELTIPADAAPGTYPVEVGMYDPATGQRLPVTLDGAPQPGDRVLLSTISVEESTIDDWLLGILCILCIFVVKYTRIH